MGSSKTQPSIHPEDERLVSQLAALQDMHDQLYHLRTLPQALVRPTIDLLRARSLPVADSSVPSKLYARIQKSAVDGLRDVETFKQSWSSEESQTLWKRTVDEQCPQGTGIWRTDYISAVRQGKSSSPHHALRPQILNPEVPSSDIRPGENLIQTFRKNHPSINLQEKGPQNELTFTIGVAAMKFHIVSKKVDDKAHYHVQYDEESNPTTQLQDGILKHLNERQTKENLEYLLDMIASYADVKRRPCDKCQRLFDKDLTFPVIRNFRSSTVGDNEKRIDSEALHSNCQPHFALPISSCGGG